MTTQVSVESLSLVTHNQVPVITTEVLAQLYGTDVDNIRKNASRNNIRFVEGTHYFIITGEDLKNLRVTFSHSQISPKARTLTLWTERGAARHAKMLETDQAWDVFGKLEDHYFNAKAEQTKKQPKQKALPNGLSIEQQCSLKELVKARAEVLPKEKQGRALITCWSALKSKFGVSYKEIHPDNFIEALSLVSRLPLEGELMEREALPAPAAKPQFTDEQLLMLAYLWMVSEHMLRNINDAYPTLNEAGYERAKTFYSIQREHPRVIQQAQALLAAATAHVQYDPRATDSGWTRVLPILRHVVIPRM